MRGQIIGWSAITSLLLAGCATSLGSTKGKSAGETSKLETKIATLETQVSELNKQIEELSRQQGPSDAQFSSNLTAASTEKTTRPQKKALSSRGIQVALKAAGFYTGPVDGRLGPQTREAVKAFQRSNGLMPDGKVGMKTTVALARFLEKE